MTEYPWYKLVPPTEPLTQGDIIPNCPVFTIKEDPDAPLEELGAIATAQAVDCFVLTQACDLAQNPVLFITLAPVYSLDAYKGRWEAARQAMGKSTNAEAWGNFREALRKNFVVNLVLLHESKAEDGKILLPYQVVDFQEIYTLPRTFLQKWVEKKTAERSRLLPPYREHVSQAFARYFMRIGLPQDVPPFA